MIKNAKNLGLVALLSGLTACSVEEYHKPFGFSRINEKDNVQQNQLPASQDPANNSNNAFLLGYSQVRQGNGLNYSNLNAVSDNSLKENISARIGPFDISSSQDREALQVKFSYLPVIEFRTNQQEVYQNGNDFTDFNNDFDYWVVGNEQNYQEQQPVPISFLGRIAKDLLWGSDAAKPLRKIGDGLDSLSDAPASFIFGRGSRSQVKLKLDSERMGIGWNVRNGRWNVCVDYQQNLDNEEYAVGISVGVQIGPQKIVSLFNY